VRIGLNSGEVLAARIDRLPEREKELLQAAAVVGREFGESLLAEVVDHERSERVFEADGRPLRVAEVDAQLAG
jgi:predicted ATPase